MDQKKGEFIFFILFFSIAQLCDHEKLTLRLVIDSVFDPDLSLLSELWSIYEPEEKGEDKKETRLPVAK